MSVPRPLCATVTFAVLGASCATDNRDASDRQAFFVDARVRKDLEGEVDHDGTFLELGWNLAEGDADGVDYSIHTVALGFGLDGRIGEDGWAGVASGIAWQHSDFDAATPVLDGEDGIGPYIAVQGGWVATPWLEAFARGDLALYFPDFSSLFGFEAGARFHVIEHAPIFVGWRYARYYLADLDAFFAVDSIELDTSGLVVGLEYSF